VAVRGWIVDKSAAARGSDPVVSGQLIELAGLLYVCPVGELELLYSARSARDYDARRSQLHSNFRTAAAPSDVFERALRLQRDLAHHHGMWHRIPIPDLLIAENGSPRCVRSSCAGSARDHRVGNALAGVGPTDAVKARSISLPGRRDRRPWLARAIRSARR
jgi:predicted nucleic acid-binding protein